MTIHISEDIVPAAVFKRQQSAMLKRLRDSPRPLIITQHGQAAAVVLSPSEYDRLTGELDLREALAGAEQAYTDGQVVSHSEALDSKLDPAGRPADGASTTEQDYAIG